MSLNNWESSREEKVSEIEEILKSYLPKQEGFQKVILEAMEYSLMAGGKRLRPMLMLETYRMFGGKSDSPFCGCPGDDPYLFPRT